LNEDAFADRDAFGLTRDDWWSFLGDGPEFYSGPALLWWALVGSTLDHGPNAMSDGPLPELLSSILGDVRALATLASTSQDDDVQALAPALENLCRRIATAAEIATRLQEDDTGESGPCADPPSPTLPALKPPRRHH
jgi:hypothetical protein